MTNKTDVIPAFIAGTHRAIHEMHRVMARWVSGTSPGMTSVGGWVRERSGGLAQVLLASVAVLAFTTTPAFAAGGGDISPFVYQLMVFVIAIFVGYFVVWAVTPALHTPLMSVTNAISSVIVVGALLAVGVSSLTSGSTLARFFGFAALIMAAINIFGGFLVTSRMLAMYKKKDAKK
jgi:H+-translocating NAD(P) transhydrogenase subunit alpha